MPYKSVNELPDNVKKLPEKKQRQWMAIWNSSYDKYGDEGVAFRMANAIIEQVLDSNYYLEEQDDLDEAELTRKSINDLPDSDFAYIEPGGTKDSNGMTEPRSLRHFPIHDAAHVRNALARAPQSPFGDKAMPAISAMAKKMKIGMQESEEELEVSGISESVSYITDTELENVVEVTIIKPGWSENDRYYGRDVLKQSLPLFEGSLAFINHPTKTELRERPGRDIRDLAGYYESVSQDSDGSIKARLHLLGDNGTKLRPLIKEATRKPGLVGISINAIGQTKAGYADGRRGNVVESIVSIHSSDIVTRPAAGGTFERLVASTDWVEEVIKETPFEQWQKYHPEYTGKELVMTDELQEQLNSMKEDLEAAKSELLNARRLETARDKLEASTLPKVIHVNLIERLRALDEPDQDRVIQEQTEMIAKLDLKPIVTGAGNGTQPLKEEVTEKIVKGLFGDLNVPKPGETIWEYKKRINTPS